MLAVIIIFNNGFFSPLFGNISITQKNIYGTLLFCLFQVNFWILQTRECNMAIWTGVFQWTGWFTYRQERAFMISVVSRKVITNGCYLDEILEWFQRWWTSLTWEQHGEWLKIMDFGCKPRFGSQLCLFSSLTFSRAFPLKICTQILCWVAGQKPYEEQVSGNYQVPGHGASVNLVSGCYESESLKTGGETFMKGLWKSRQNRTLRWCLNDTLVL